MNQTMTLRARVAAPIKDVHRALTDAEALRTWLAEYAEVDLPDRYQFWGRHTPEGDAPHQRPLHVDDTTVRFSWLLDGEDTTVEITLEDEGADSTLISLSQTHFPGWEVAVAETNVRGHLQTYWCLSIANLVDHLEGRPLTPKCDFSSPTMRVQVSIAAPPTDVFDSLVNSERFGQWFGAAVDIEPHLGGRFAMGGFENDPDPGKIVEFEQDRKVALQWSDGTVAGWELEGSEGKTRMTIVQSKFGDGNTPYGAWAGWLSGIAELRRYHEVSPWQPIWLEAEVPGMPDGILAER